MAVTILAALVFVAAASLRGYLPGAPAEPRERVIDNPVASVVVVGLLIAAVTVLAVAVLARLRHRGAPIAGTAGRSDWFRGDKGRLTWRVGLVALAVTVGWLLLVAVLSRIGGGDGESANPSIGTGAPSEPTTSAPSTTVVDPPTRSPQPDAGINLLGYFYAATAIFLLVLVAGTVMSARRRQRPPTVLGEDDDDVPERDGRSESLVRAAEVGLAEVGDLSREPRKAIIACYAAMERQLARVPDAAPQDFDTASEVLARAVERNALGPDSATELVHLFEEARFSPHVMDEGHRDQAVEVLQRVLDELRSRT